MRHLPHQEGEVRGRRPRGEAEALLDFAETVDIGGACPHEAVVATAVEDEEDEVVRGHHRRLQDGLDAG